MNRAWIVASGFVLAATANLAQAGSDAQEQYAACKDALVQVYGDGTRSKMRNLRRHGGSMDMEIRVMPEAGGSEVVVCSQASDGNLSLKTKAGNELSVAAAD